MTKVLRIGDRTIASTEIIPLLATYNVIPQLVCESIIDSAIAAISCTKEEISNALEQFYQHWILNSPEKIQDWCLRYSLTQEQLERIATRKIRWEFMRK
jgi:hypothetical protein